MGRAANPIGSSAALDEATKPGDTIILLPSAEPFDGGVALKTGQTLMGLVVGDRKPSITNTDTDRNGGNGIILANDSKVIDVRIERTRASGVLGLDVSGACIIGVEVDDAQSIRQLHHVRGGRDRSHPARRDSVIRHSTRHACRK